LRSESKKSGLEAEKSEDKVESESKKTKVRMIGKWNDGKMEEERRKKLNINFKH
jgi:hypothetical protein